MVVKSYHETFAMAESMAAKLVRASGDILRYVMPEVCKLPT
jgi:hypothetical protein